MRQVRRAHSMILMAALAILSARSFAQEPTSAPVRKPPVTAIAFAPDGKSVLLAQEAGVLVCNWPALKLERRLPVKMSHVHDLALSPAADRLAIVGGSPGEEGICEVLYWPEGKSLRRDVLHADVAMAVAWSSDGRLATAGIDAQVRLFDPAKPADAARTLAGHARGVLAVTFLPGDKRLVTAGIDQTLRVWDLETGVVERTLANHTASVVAISVRPQQPIPAGQPAAPAMLASIGRDRTLRFWQPSIGRMVRFARLPSEPISLAWSSDGSVVAAGCVDGRVRVIDPDTAEVLETLSACEGWIYALAAIPGERGFLAGGENGQATRVARAKVRP